MLAIFYHATRAKYEAGVLVEGKELAVHRQNKEVDSILDSLALAPDEAPLRSASCFAFGDLADAVAYAESGGTRSTDTQSTVDSAPFLFYRVEMESLLQAPFVLVDRLAKKLDSSNAVAEIAREYWQPTLRWRFWEFLTSRMRVVELVDKCDTPELAGALYRHHEDMELAKKRWP